MRITAYGKPITQGSKVKTRWGGIRDDNSATLKPWRDNVRSAALTALALGPEDNLGMAERTAYPFGAKPTWVRLTFTFSRPAGHYGTGRNASTLRGSAPPFPSGHGSGDIDKLVRACLDALTDAGVWRDDAQVVDVAARKVYVGAPEALDRPGVVIDVHAVHVGQEVLL